MSFLTKKEIADLKSLELWLEDNVEMDSEMSFDDVGDVKSEGCLSALSKLTSALNVLAITNKVKAEVSLKASTGYDCVRCSKCDENDNFVIMKDGTIECANCSDGKGHLVPHA